MPCLSATLTNAVFVYLCFCICVFASQTPKNIVFNVLLPWPFQKYSTCHVCLQLWPMQYLRICVFVYLQVRHPGTLFLRSCYHYLFKNIAHVMSVYNFDQFCICVFVYLYLCICKSDTWEPCFWGPCIITFQKIYGLYGLKHHIVEMEVLPGGTNERTNDNGR